MGANFVLRVDPDLKGGKNDNSTVASPESVSFFL